LKRAASILTFLLFYSSVFAQQFYIKGEIKDEIGNPLQNVSIILHSTGYLYSSGNSGGFGILTSRKIDTLTVSADGFVKQNIPIDAATFQTIVLKKNNAKSQHRYKLSSLTKNLQRDVQQQWFLGDETYASLIENGFVNAASYPNTGVTLNVDRASYSNIRRFVNMRSFVPPDAVRIEEMLNYFNIGYTEPKNNNTFEISSYLTNCPWNNANQLLITNIKSRKINLDSLPPTHLVFLIDVSGSMDMPNRLPLLKAGFRGLINNIRQKDSISIVVYGGTTAVLANAVSGDQKDSLFRIIDGLEPGGSTPGESGIRLAYNVAKAHFIKGGNNRVILATDGDFNVGLQKDEDLEDFILSQKAQGIYLTCLGVGMGNYKDSKIQTLAQKGNGNFAYLDSYAEAEKVLLKEFLQTLYTVADDVYLTLNFNPRYVKEYRLIGFDNKVGAIKDTSATIEGGEISSAFSLLVAIEIVPLGESDLTKPVYPAAYTLQYKVPKDERILEEAKADPVSFTPFNELDRSYRFASSVMLFGLLLRESKYVKQGGAWNELIQLANASADMQNIAQTEFLSLIEQAKLHYGKKKKPRQRE
jgi:Ca-activated chloride channel family protein